MKTSELQSAALDWAVAKAEGHKIVFEKKRGDFDGWYVETSKYVLAKIGKSYSPSTNWSKGGPIIEREFITIMALEDGGWTASVGELWVAEEGGICGPTPLIAAMRCYVASKLGDTVEIPEELK
jgi:hypothetical protein